MASALLLMASGVTLMAEPLANGQVCKQAKTWLTHIYGSKHLENLMVPAMMALVPADGGQITRFTSPKELHTSHRSSE